MKLDEKKIIVCENYLRQLNIDRFCKKAGILTS